MNLRTRKYAILILIIALVARLGFAFFWHAQAESEGRLFRLGDSHSYWTLAGQIAGGLPYQYGSENASIFRAPLYPLVLAPLTSLGDQGIWWARVLGACLGTVTVGLVMRLAGRFSGGCGGLCAGGLTALYPSAIGMSCLVLSEAIFMPLMIAHLLMWQKAWSAENDRSTFLHAALGGTFAGLAVLARPSWLLFLPFAFGIGILVGPHRRRHVLLFAGSVLGLCVVMSPWWIRNATITGHFVPTTLQVGPSLYDGLHEGATGASDEGMQFMSALLEEQMLADQESNTPPESTLEYRLHSRAMRSATQWAWEHPVEVARLAIKKFQRTWSFWPDGGEISSNTTRAAISISCAFVVLLAFMGFGQIHRSGWIAAVCWIPCIYFTLLHMVFVGSIRYREPAIVVLTALAGGVIATLLGCSSKSQSPNHPPLAKQGSKAGQTQEIPDPQ